jgi:hypothetical protein
MTTGLVTRSFDSLNQDEVFKFDGYNPLISYGPDRPAFNQLKQTFESNNEAIHTLDLCSLDDITGCIMVDIDYDYLDRLLSLDDPPVLIYVMREPPSVLPENSSTQLIRLASLFDAVLTWNPSLSVLDSVVEYNIPQYLQPVTGSQPPAFSEQSLLTNISSRKHSDHPEELYSEREVVIRYYDRNHPESFNLFGRYWNQRPRPAEIFYDKQFSYETYQVYRGLAESKRDVYLDHKFALCFENMTGIDGYVTEKIFDCFRGQTVPIYWGAEDIERYVPPETFVDYRDFGSPKALHEYISSIDRDRYQDYLDAADEFISEDADHVSTERYAQQIYNAATNTEDMISPQFTQSLRQEIAERGARERFIRRSPEKSFGPYCAALGRQFIDSPESVRQNMSLAVRSLWKRVT